ncbi:MAG: cation transporter [Melioribacteraceae bacterium]|nr:cation transporter [Melioribacteraceae bacterium]
MNSSKIKLYNLAFLLALITILYNAVEGTVSTVLGFSDETIALFGFGVDSFIEVISGVGIAHMILRIKKNDNQTRDEFEKTALRITGTAFFLLTVGLVITSVSNIIIDHKPETTFWGVVISSVSIITMAVLIKSKLNVGRKLNSPAIIADANCTKVCLYMSLVLLASSGLFEITGIGYFDSIGSLGLAYFSFNEGKECFEKVKSGKLCCDDHCAS